MLNIEEKLHRRQDAPSPRSAVFFPSPERKKALPVIFTSINAGRNEVWERYEKDNDRKRETKREDDERMSERREGADDEFFFSLN